MVIIDTIYRYITSTQIVNYIVLEFDYFDLEKGAFDPN